MAVIKVGKPPASAFNKNRPASKLLKSQVQHLEWAVRPASRRKPNQLPKISVKTEGQAAARIAELTRQLHPDLGQAAPASPPAPGVLKTKTRPKKRMATRPARRRRTR